MARGVSLRLRPDASLASPHPRRLLFARGAVRGCRGAARGLDRWISLDRLARGFPDLRLRPTRVRARARGDDAAEHVVLRLPQLGEARAVQERVVQVEHQQQLSGEQHPLLLLALRLLQLVVGELQPRVDVPHGGGLRNAAAFPSAEPRAAAAGRRLLAPRPAAHADVVQEARMGGGTKRRSSLPPRPPNPDGPSRTRSRRRRWRSALEPAGASPRGGAARRPREARRRRTRVPRLSARRRAGARPARRDWRAPAARRSRPRISVAPGSSPGYPRPSSAPRARRRSRHRSRWTTRSSPRGRAPARVVPSFSNVSNGTIMEIAEFARKARPQSAPWSLREREGRALPRRTSARDHVHQARALPRRVRRARRRGRGRARAPAGFRRGRRGPRGSRLRGVQEVRRPGRGLHQRPLHLGPGGRGDQEAVRGPGERTGGDGTKRSRRRAREERAKTRPRPETRPVVRVASRPTSPRF